MQFGIELEGMPNLQLNRIPELVVHLGHFLHLYIGKIGRDAGGMGHGLQGYWCSIG